MLNILNISCNKHRDQVKLAWPPAWLCVFLGPSIKSTSRNQRCKSYAQPLTPGNISRWSRRTHRGKNVAEATRARRRKRKRSEVRPPKHACLRLSVCVFDLDKAWLSKLLFPKTAKPCGGSLQQMCIHTGVCEKALLWRLRPFGRYACGTPKSGGGEQSMPPDGRERGTQEGERFSQTPASRRSRYYDILYYTILHYTTLYYTILY